MTFVASFAMLCPDGYGYVKGTVGETMEGIVLFIIFDSDALAVKKTYLKLRSVTNLQVTCKVSIISTTQHRIFPLCYLRVKSVC